VTGALRARRVGAYVVCSADSQLLLCRVTAMTGRPGWWTLPGGGVEHGEHPEAAVVPLVELGLLGTHVASNP